PRASSYPAWITPLGLLHLLPLIPSRTRAPPASSSSTTSRRPSTPTSSLPATNSTVESLCVALSNGGFGPPAGELAGVVPANLLPYWYSTDQFSLELIFHRRILAHRCRTADPSAAAAFYIPFYAGLSVGKHLWSGDAASRDRDSALLLRWIKEQSPWKRSNGSDHFIALGRISWDFHRSGNDGWGGSFLNMAGMEKVTRLIIERNPSDKGRRSTVSDGVPPRTAAEVRQWQRFVLNRNRSTLFVFAGAPRPQVKDDFRGFLFKECKRAGKGTCRSLDWWKVRRQNRSSAAMRLFLDSAFCLQPKGDSYTRRSMFDCMLVGAVPVVFWRHSAYGQYEWYLPGSGEGREGEWSVFIDSREVKNGTVSVKEVLEGIGEKRAREMRERVVEMIPRLLYAAADEGLGEGMQDAFDVAVKGVLRRFRGAVVPAA
ncbi:Exostosin family, partial [Musa troglodytarum]